MSTDGQELRFEQTRLDQVMIEIDNQIITLQQNVTDIKTDIVEIRRNFWDDVTVNFDDAHEAAETYASMKQQAEVLSERERTHRHAQKQLKTLQRLKLSPYFGRIDLLEDGEVSSEEIYLGIASLLDDQDEQFLVYDWRAPVASLYYDYSPGSVEYETPSGTISGKMELKRQYIIREGHIRSMFDTGVTIGDELLQEVLGKQSDSQMKSIVATIQREQNRIIRNERSRLLIVQGAAGSGKTSAALQRVAYLLYRYRDTLQAEQIVLFSPNPLFNSYISTVLPELGEKNMQQTTFHEYLEHRLGGTFELEDPFTQLEYVHTAMHDPHYKTRVTAIQYKASLPFMRTIDRYLETLGIANMPFKDICFRDRTLIAADTISQRFYSLDPSLAIPNRMRLLAEWLLCELKEIARRERNKPWVEDEIELLDNEDFHRVYKQLQKKKRMSGATFDDYEMERKLLAASVVNEHFAPISTEVKRLGFIDMPAVYQQLFALAKSERSTVAVEAAPVQWDAICSHTLEKLSVAQLSYEDATPYLYLKERIEGFHTNTSVRHVFIDEAQDYSPFQFAFLKKLFPYAKMTVLGDLNQAIYAHVRADASLDQFSAFFGADETETIILTRSYRSTRPIVELTRRLIDGGEAIEPFNRDGQKPTLTTTATPKEHATKIRERILELQKSGHRTIAVIGKTAQESQAAYDLLAGELPIRLIEKETVSFEPGTLVIPAYLAKGVEFDAVIIYDASAAQYSREEERKLFYTACTRAMHELHLYSLGGISPFLEALPSEFYVRQP